MPKKLTQEEFVARAIALHGTRYDYSKAVYAEAKAPICIICPEHGVFMQSPDNHLSGKGCNKCGQAQGTQKRSFSVNDFIAKAQAVHGSFYNYSLTQYTTGAAKVIITCPEHGNFSQQATSHLRGHGCPSCVSNPRLTNQDFIARAVSVHGSRYDYSLSLFVNSKTKLVISCPRHGAFSQEPSSHLAGCGCPVCANELRNKGRIEGLDKFVERANKVHGNRYTYDKCSYKNYSNKVIITCASHGDFEQTAQLHLKGYGCPDCGGSKPLDTDSFIEKAKQKHGADTYDYSLANYKNARTKVLIVCPVHGPFKQDAHTHLIGRGCAKCSALRATHSGLAGYKKRQWLAIQNNRTATLYLIKLSGEGEEFYKIGITYRSVEARFKDLKHYKIETVCVLESLDASWVFDIEKSIIRRFIKSKYRPLVKFDGYTECFRDAVEILDTFLQLQPQLQQAA